MSTTNEDVFAQLRDLLAAAEAKTTTEPAASQVPASPAVQRIGELKVRPVLDAAEVVELGNVSLSTVRRAIRAGELPAHRVGRRVKVPTPAALAWLGAVPAGNAS